METSLVGKPAARARNLPNAPDALPFGEATVIDGVHAQIMLVEINLTGFEVVPALDDELADRILPLAAKRASFESQAEAHAEATLAGRRLKVEPLPLARGKAGVCFEVGGFGRHHGGL